MTMNARNCLLVRKGRSWVVQKVYQAAESGRKVQSNQHGLVVAARIITLIRVRKIPQKRGLLTNRLIRHL
jgi:hypothetical protein